MIKDVMQQFMEGAQWARQMWMAREQLKIQKETQSMQKKQMEIDQKNWFWENAATLMPSMKVSEASKALGVPGIKGPMTQVKKEALDVPVARSPLTVSGLGEPKTERVTKQVGTVKAEAQAKPVLSHNAETVLNWWKKKHPDDEAGMISAITKEIERLEKGESSESKRLLKVNKSVYEYLLSESAVTEEPLYLQTEEMQRVKGGGEYERRGMMIEEEMRLPAAGQEAGAIPVAMQLGQQGLTDVNNQYSFVQPEFLSTTANTYTDLGKWMDDVKAANTSGKALYELARDGTATDDPVMYALKATGMIISQARGDANIPEGIQMLNFYGSEEYVNYTRFLTNAELSVIQGIKERTDISREWKESVIKQIETTIGTRSKASKLLDTVMRIKQQYQLQHGTDAKMPNKELLDALRTNGFNFTSGADFIDQYNSYVDLLETISDTKDMVIERPETPSERRKRLRLEKKALKGE